MSGLEEAMAAIKSGDSEALARLLQTDPDLALASDEQGVPLVMSAIYHGRRDLAETISSHQTSPDIFAAAALGKVDLLARHLAEDATRVHARTADGFTALHLAAFFGGPEAVAALLAAGADPHAVAENPMQVRPLNSAIAGGHVESVRALLAAGVDIDAEQQQQVTPLMGAAAGGHREIVEILLAAGADKTRTSADGSTAADYARQRGHEELVPLLQV